jgi:two-component system response regulator AtoC
VEDERWFHQQLKAWVPEAEWVWAGTLESARRELGERTYDVILLDRNLGPEQGFSLLPELSRLAPGSVCVVISSEGDGDSIREALELGAKDYLVKSSDMREDLRLRLEIAWKTRASERLLLSRSGSLEGDGSGWIGDSVASRILKEKAKKIAPFDAPVLITGESGTGKEVFAQEVHRLRGDPKRPFVALNCGAIPESMFESELFGHRRGAFTGALTHREGLVRVADGGDLFLDEIGDLPLSQQVKLLRFLQDGTFTPVGADRAESSRVRVIAATHRNLEQEVAAGRFREDLFFRLDVYRVHTVPLRERREDVIPLVRFFLARIAGSKRKISREALALLEKQEWKGNVRELSAMIQRAVIEAGDEDLRPAHFRFPGSTGGTRGLRIPSTRKEVTSDSYREYMKSQESAWLQAALTLFEGSTLELAQALRLSRATIYNRIETLGIRVSKKKEQK